VNCFTILMCNVRCCALANLSRLSQFPSTQLAQIDFSLLNYQSIGQIFSEILTKEYHNLQTRLNNESEIALD